MNAKDKVRGCFLGIAIGDALGKPTETYTASQIAEKFGRLTKYIVNTEHKYYDGMPAGSWTDDTQLSLAVARGFLHKGEFDLDAIAEEHCAEFMLSVNGWGKTTKEAVAKMVDGAKWDQASLTDEKNRGTGNGICMKVAPVGLYMALTNPDCNNPQWANDVKKLSKLATMTHFTSMAITSGFAQAFATFKCFQSDPNNFDLDSFIRTVAGSGKMGRRYLFKTIGDDDIASRLLLLEKHKEFNTERIINELKGTCYVYDSLPFTLMFFVKNPYSIESMYDVASSGGDTDTNASMLGALLGALHGTKIFPKELVVGLYDREKVMDTADKFYKRFFND
jgi:ADP-ribosylglycohydrolase